MMPGGRKALETDPALAFRAKIHRALDVRFVEYRFVRAYIEELELLLEDIRGLYKSHPGVALDLILEFLGKIPRIFDSIDDETELAEFCTELCATAIDFSTRLKDRFPASSRALLDAFEHDDYGRFSEVPSAFLSVPLQIPQREWLLAEVRKRKSRASSALAGDYGRFLTDLERANRRARRFLSKG
jgi:hypothetical protein